jgi:acylphosphatase
MKHIKVYISGKVQGVFFRASTKEKADELGIKGFVMNLPDGRVYLEAEGRENILIELLEWCKKGPKEAIVNEIVSEQGELLGYKKFEILR